MKRVIHLFISAGESSGDRLGASLLADLVRLLGDDARLDIKGMGGPLMHALAPDLEGLPERPAAGMVELLPGLGDLARRYAKLSRQISRNPPDLAVLIDFPDFNLRLGHRLKAKNVPVLYYAAPQCWAWRTGRVAKLNAVADRLAVLFPFEADWFRAHGLRADYVGHPLSVPLPAWQTVDKRNEIKTIGLFPGSRSHEIAAILPVQLDAVRLINAHTPGFAKFAIHVPEHRRKQAQQLAVTHDIPIETEYRADRAFDLAWCAAGTITLELALTGVPLIVTHKMHPLSYKLAERFVRTDHIALPNIILKRRAVPELLQQACTPSAVVHWSMRLLQKGRNREKVLDSWRELRHHFKTFQPEKKAAECLLELSKQSSSRRRNP